MALTALAFLAWFCAATPTSAAPLDPSSSPDQQTAYTVPAAFPTSAFSSYYVSPGPSVQPQPLIVDPLTNTSYPLNLTDPRTIPQQSNDPVVFPKPAANLSDDDAKQLVADIVADMERVVASNVSACDRCIAALELGQLAARLAPALVPDAMASLCEAAGVAPAELCHATLDASNYGATWTQLLAYADVGGLDGQFICALVSKQFGLNRPFCPLPGVTGYNVTFPKPRPRNPVVPSRSGQRVKVLHLSDWHLDPRYDVGSEANCTQNLCCRAPLSSSNLTAQQISMPASLYGYYLCDSPYYLVLAALQSIGPLTGTSLQDPPALTLYTGDLVSHDLGNQISRPYVEYTYDAVWQLFKTYIGGPVYAALGNHDSSPADMDAPHEIDHNGTLGQQFSWNYKHQVALWNQYGFIDDTVAQEANLHYAAYSVVHPLGLRVITINTDFYYLGNAFTVVRAGDPDFSGMFSFLVRELQKAEDAGQRVWIMGHVPSGWDGTDAMPNGADAFFQIVERYSPHVIANVFFGHTHQDQAFVYYSNNGTSQTAENAIANAWVGPSLTPLTNVNSGYRLYEVDTGSWEVMDAYTYFADVDSFSSLSSTGPVFRLEYSTRDAYGSAAGWPDDAPLNATFWHRVTEAMERRGANAGDPADGRQLVELFNRYQGKSCSMTPNCTSEACTRAKVCYMRSGSAALGQACPQGFGTVSDPYTGENF